MAETDKKLEKLRDRNFKNERYPEACPECGERLKGVVWHEGSDPASTEQKAADLHAWMARGGRCPRPACNAQVICPTCGKPLTTNAPYCPACNTRLEAPKRTCARCGVTYERFRTSCPQCGLPARLACEQDGSPMRYEEKYCPRCRHYNDWDKIYPDGKAQPTYTPSPLNGSFVITPYGPMFVFDPMPAQEPAPAPKPMAPAPVIVEEPAPIEEPEPVYTEPKKDRRAIAGLVFAILSILLCPIFPFALIAIGLGISGKQAHPKIGAAAVILGFIGLVLCVALCVWLFLYGGWNWFAGLTGLPTLNLNV